MSKLTLKLLEAFENIDDRGNEQEVVQKLLDFSHDKVTEIGKTIKSKVQVLKVPGYWKWSGDTRCPIDDYPVYPVESFFKYQRYRSFQSAFRLASLDDVKPRRISSDGHEIEEGMPAYHLWIIYGVYNGTPAPALEEQGVTAPYAHIWIRCEAHNSEPDKILVNMFIDKDLNISYLDESYSKSSTIEDFYNFLDSVKSSQ